MEINLKAEKTIPLKDLLKINHFSPKLISILERNGLNTLININKGQNIKIALPIENNDLPIEKENIDIVYEDDYFIIINKNHDIASIPSIRHYDHNLSNQLSYYYQLNDIHSSIHPITRLDFKTNGLIIFAKHRYIHNLFKYVNINKFYKATLKGILPINKGYLSFPIKDTDSMKREISINGKKSLTYFEVVKYENNNTIVNIKLLTGRTHQIRRHFSYLGYPIIGDDLYGNSDGILKLTCYKLNFIHPISNKEINISI